MIVGQKNTDFRHRFTTKKNTGHQQKRGNSSVTVEPFPGALRTSSVPPNRAARSRIPARPNDIGLANALSASKPVPLSRMLNLMFLSVEFSKSFMRVAWECLRMLFKDS